MLDTKKFGSVPVGRQGTEPEGTRNKLEPTVLSLQKQSGKRNSLLSNKSCSANGRQQRSVAKSIGN